MVNGEESLPEIKKWREVRKKLSREKKSRRKYRRLEEEKRMDGVGKVLEDNPWPKIDMSRASNSSE